MWQEKGNNNIWLIEKTPVCNLRTPGVTLSCPNKNIVIDLSGIYSIRKRRIIRDNSYEIVYKVTIEEILTTSKFVGIEEIESRETKVDLIFPIIKTINSLSGKRQRRLLVSERRKAIEFSVNSQGKVIG